MGWSFFGLKKDKLIVDFYCDLPYIAKTMQT